LVRRTNQIAATAQDDGALLEAVVTMPAQTQELSAMKHDPITSIMTTDLTTVHDGDPVSKIRKIFAEQNIHHIPVVSGEQLIGMISWNDFMRVSFGEFDNQDAKQLDSILDQTYKIHDIMKVDLVTIPKSATIREAARILGLQDFHSLPVVDGGKLVGLVTSTDLMRYLAEL
jgi:CBS domain-containing protein